MNLHVALDLCIILGTQHQPIRHYRLAREANLQSEANTHSKNNCLPECQQIALEHLDTASVSLGIRNILGRKLPKLCSASFTLNAQAIICTCHCCFLKGDGLPLQPAVRSCQLWEVQYL